MEMALGYCNPFIPGTMSSDPFAPGAGSSGFVLTRSAHDLGAIFAGVDFGVELCSELLEAASMLAFSAVCTAFAR